MNIYLIKFTPLLLFTLVLAVFFPSSFTIVLYAFISVFLLLNFLELELTNNFRFFSKTSLIAGAFLYILSSSILCLISYNYSIIMEMINLSISYISVYSILLSVIYIRKEKNNFIEILCIINLFAMTYSGKALLDNNLNTDFILLYFISIMFFVSIYSLLKIPKYKPLEHKYALYISLYSLISIFTNMIFSYLLNISNEILSSNLMSILDYEILFISISVVTTLILVRKINLLKFEFALIIFLLARGVLAKILGYINLEEDLKLYYGYIHFTTILLKPVLFILVIFNRNYFSKAQLIS